MLFSATRGSKYVSGMRPGMNLRPPGRAACPFEFGAASGNEDAPASARTGDWPHDDGVP